jgi:hypothetical protein
MAYKIDRSPADKHAYYQNKVIAPVPVEPTVEPQIGGEKPVENAVAPEPVQDPPEPTEKDYVSVIKKVKKENITPENIGEIMLCQIPGISSVTALAILEQYKTLPNLIKEIEANSNCLANITSTNAKGQTRKINKTSIANIVKFLSKK